MTLFTHYGHTCPVTECPHNRGKRGLSCGFASDPVLVCLHPVYKRLWQEATGFGMEWDDHVSEPEPGPVQEVLL